MSPVEFKKMQCRPVEFKGQGPLSCVRTTMNNASVGPREVICILIG